MSLWEVILGTITSEFSDINDIEQNTRVTLRLGLAAVLGGVLGYERENQGKSAGLRTHMLVSLGAALFVIGADPTGTFSDKMSRVIQGVVTGIGFLGAGTIIKSESLSNIRGLTTAAGLWLTAAMGVAVGLGQEVVAILATLLALTILYVVPLLLEPKTTEKNDDE
ncbi:MAG: MgtC/SapB family protein [Desulfobacteraceae bacterium]|nr:MgtC/SapB family protein [Desulfobacteraceae bacterium]